MKIMNSNAVKYIPESVLVTLYQPKELLCANANLRISNKWLEEQIKSTDEMIKDDIVKSELS